MFALRRHRLPSKSLVTLVIGASLWSQHQPVPVGPCGKPLCASLRFNVVDGFGRPLEYRVAEFAGRFRGMETVPHQKLLVPLLPIGGYRYKLVPINAGSPFQSAEGNVLVQEGDQWLTILAREKYVDGERPNLSGSGRVVPPPDPSKTNWVRVEEVFANNVVEEVPLRPDGSFALRTIPHRGKYLITIISGTDIYATRQITVERGGKWRVEIHPNM